MRTRKGIAVTLGFVMVAAALASCSSGSSEDNGDLVASSLLTKIQNEKVISIGTYTDTEPYAWKDKDGVLKGYDVDLANDLAEALGAKINWIVATDETRIPSLQSGKADVMIASFTSNPTRAKQISFTRPYSTTGVLGVTKKDSPLKSYEDLAGKTVGVSRGSTADLWIKDHYPDIKLQEFSTSADAYQAIRSGKVDATMDEMTLLGAVVASDDSLRFLNDEVLAQAPISIGLKQGDPVWQAYLDNFVMDWIFSGKAAQSYQKWMQRDFPSDVLM